MIFPDPEEGLDDLFMADTAGVPERASQSTGAVAGAHLATEDMSERPAFAGAPYVNPPTHALWQDPVQCQYCTAEVNPNTDTCSMGHIQEIRP